MSAARQLLLQKAVKNITKTVYFTNRWIHIDSLLKAVTTRYKLANLEVSKATLSRHIGKLEPDIDRVALYHVTGVYRVNKNREVFYYFQENPRFQPY